MSNSLSLRNIVQAQPGWYRGDFHAHTNFSDGFHAPPQLLELAKSERLDFFAVTDHNTFEAFAHFGVEPGPLIIPGVEVTTREGHFNVFGMEGPLDWLEALWMGRKGALLQGNYGTVGALLVQAATEGLLTSINHPLLHPWEWRDLATDLRRLHCLEIWNDPSWPDNRQANPETVAMWTRALNAGFRITAIGGSDYHRPAPKPGENKPPDRLGLPSTYVFADALSGAAILHALRERRAYVSMGPLVTLQAHKGAATYEIGADLGRVSGSVEWHATVSQAPSQAYVRLVKNGEIIAEVRVEGGDATLRWSSPVDADQPAWYRLDVADQHEQFLAITNPIFVGPRFEPTVQTFGDLLAR